MGKGDHLGPDHPFALLAIGPLVQRDAVVFRVHAYFGVDVDEVAVVRRR